MYQIFGLKRNLENVLLLSRDQLAGRVPTGPILKAAYNRRLAVTQPSITVNERPMPDFVEDAETASHLASLYQNDGNHLPLTADAIEGALRRQDPARRARRVALVKEALSVIHRELPFLGTLFDLAINRIFFFEMHGRGGGSNANAIGVIWANPMISWNSNDVIEFLIHELTHNLLFVEEAIRGIYTDLVALERPVNFVRSAILRIPRRMDLAIHSLMVGVEILLARDRWLGHTKPTRAHPSSPQLLADCQACLESVFRVEACRDLLTDNGWYLLKHVEQMLSAQQWLNAA